MHEQVHCFLIKGIKPIHEAHMQCKDPWGAEGGNRSLTQERKEMIEGRRWCERSMLWSAAREARDGGEVEQWWGEQQWAEGKWSSESGEADSKAWPRYSHSLLPCSLSPSLAPFSSFSSPSFSPLKCPINYPLVKPPLPTIPPFLSDPLAGCPTWPRRKKQRPIWTGTEEREEHKEK